MSQAHNVVFGRLYGFLLYNNFLILFLSSSLNTYYAILENPHDTLVQLGNFLPQISSFYVAYILIKALAGEHHHMATPRSQQTALGSSHENACSQRTPSPTHTVIQYTASPPSLSV